MSIRGTRFKTAVTRPNLPDILSSLGDDENSSKDDTAGDSRLSLANSMHWILHWDINETILVGDEVGGDTREDCLNKIIAKSAFVRMPMANEETDLLYDYDNTSSLVPTHWWDGTPIEQTPSDSGICAQKNLCPPLYTGWNWPKGCCPYYRTSYKRLAKNFVSGHGSIYRHVYDEMQSRVVAVAPLKESSVFQNILPAFFHTIYNMVHRQQDGDKIALPVTIVFRTFGTDLPTLALAMSAFAQGRHPDYPDFIHPEYELSTSRLYNAKWIPINESTTSSNSSNSPNSPVKTRKELFEYQLFCHDGGSIVPSGDEELFKLLHQTSNGQYVHGIRNDYSMWKTHNWEPWAGKPVWMTTKDSEHHHLLLDDNIHNLPYDGIASVRRPSQFTNTDSGTCKYEFSTGSEIQALHGLHLIRVPTIEPILNKDWFLQQIGQVQTAAIQARNSETF